MTESDFSFKDYDYKLLEKIAPLMLYPNNWIRNEAIEFICTIINKVSPYE